MVTNFMVQRLILSDDKMPLESYSDPFPKSDRNAKKPSICSIEQCTNKSLSNVLKSSSCFCNEHL